MDKKTQENYEASVIICPLPSEIMLRVFSSLERTMTRNLQSDGWLSSEFSLMYKVYLCFQRACMNFYMLFALKLIPNATSIVSFSSQLL